MPFHQVGSIYFFIFYFYILYIYSIAYSEDGCIYRKVFFPPNKKKKKNRGMLLPIPPKRHFLKIFPQKQCFSFIFFSRARAMTRN